MASFSKILKMGKKMDYGALKHELDEIDMEIDSKIAEIIF